MAFWLLLALLFAPTLLALLSRLVARRGNNRGAALVAAAGFAACIACALGLRWLPLETGSLGPLQFLMPSTEIAVAREPLLDPQPSPAAAPSESERLPNGDDPQASTAGDQPRPAPSDLRPSTFDLRPTAAPEPTATPAPAAVPTATAQSSPEPTATPQRASRREPLVEPTAEPVEEPAAVERYVVEPGDTLGEIAALYDVDPAELQQYNGLSDAEADSLDIGQVLFIPPN